MRKLLTATTALALVGGAAFAEISFTGDGKIGVDYDASMDGPKHIFRHEAGVDFSGSGTTDGGMSFGVSAGFDSESKGGDGADSGVNTGSAYVSGAFGKLTIGDHDAADVLAGGIADVGLFGIGVDDVAEGLRGGTPDGIRYDHSFGDIAVALSGGTNAGENEHAAGMSFTASGVKVGAGFDSRDVTSLGLGYSMGQISVNLLYSRIKNGEGVTVYNDDKGDNDDSNDEFTLKSADGDRSFEEIGSVSGKGTQMGMDLSYTIGASTLTLVYAKNDADQYEVTFGETGSETTIRTGDYSETAYGIGITHDLGGGAKLIAGFGSVPDDDGVSATFGTPEGEVVPATIQTADKNKASIGLSFSF